VDFSRHLGLALRRWPIVLAVALALTSTGALAASCGTTSYTARAQILLRENPYLFPAAEFPGLLPGAWERSASPAVLLGDPLLEKTLKASLKSRFPASTETETASSMAALRAGLSARHDAASNAVVLAFRDASADRAVDAVNAFARAFDDAAQDRLRLELDKAREFLERAIKERAAAQARNAREIEALGPLPPESPAEREEKAYVDELAGLERSLSAARLESEALAVEVDLLMARLERGEVGAAPPAAEPPAAELEAAQRELEAIRLARPDDAARLAEAAARVETLRRARAEALERELLRSRFAPVRQILEELRAKAARRDALARSMTAFQARAEDVRRRIEEQRRTRGTPATMADRERREKRRVLESEAQRLAASAVALRTLQGQLADARALTSSPAQKIDLAAAAEPSSTPAWGRLPGWALMGLLAGLAVAFAAGRAAATIRTERDVRAYVNLPLWGQVEDVEDGEATLVRAAPAAPLAETYGALAAVAERRLHEAEARILLVSSASPGEGKSTVACNLAVTLARAGARTVLVDADLRRPVQHSLFSLPNEVGLASHLSGSVEQPDALAAPTEVPGLDLIPAGPLPAAPLPALRSEKLKTLLAALREKYEYVILDGPPVRGLADALVLAPRADAALLVLSAGESRKDEVTEAKRLLRAAGAELAGSVLNRATARSRGYYYYGSAAVAEAAE
jgi:capsular exopolysaccharide synthesis family protein